MKCLNNAFYGSYLGSLFIFNLIYVLILLEKSKCTLVHEDSTKLNKAKNSVFLVFSENRYPLGRFSDSKTDFLYS